MFRCVIRSSARKIFVRCPNKLKVVGNLEMLNNYEEKCILSTLFFNETMLLCINQRLSAIFSTKRMEGTRMASRQFRAQRSFTSSVYLNRQFFFGSLKVGTKRMQMSLESCMKTIQTVC